MVRLARTKRSEQGGYVAAMTALMLVPLMIMAAFAIDIGSWYSIGAQTQTAADAAALSAVAHLPDVDAAVAAAFEEAARNGFVDVDGHSQASFDTPTSYPQILVSLPSDFEVQVEIKTEGEALFGRVVFDGIEIQRLARSQFIRPVTMGNPTSQLGGSHLADPTDKTGAFWLRVMGYCDMRANGARHFVGFENTRMGCPGTPNNNTFGHSYAYSGINQWNLGAQDKNNTVTLNGPTANPNSWYEGNTLRDDYFLAIDLSAAEALQSWRVQIYRPGACSSEHEGYWNYGAAQPRVMRPGPGVNSNSLRSPRIRTRLYNVDNTLVDRWNAITAGNIRNETYWQLDDCSGDVPAPGNNYTGWYTISTIGGATSEEGTHYLSYGSDPVLNEFWSNTFAIRVVPTASNAICTDLTGAAVCPSVSAVDDLPIYIDSEDEFGAALFAANEVVELYLAPVPQEHAGKTLRIQLFDAGEGMDYLQVLDPTGTPVTFTWFSDACARTGFCGAGGNGADLVGGTSSSTGCAATPCLSVTGNRFQNNDVTIEVPIPSGYTCTNCFWKVRYKPGGGGTVTDATEWSIAITGDPVRLTD